MRGLNVTDVRRENIPLLWSTGGETALAKGFCFNMEWGGGVFLCQQKNEAVWKECTQQEGQRNRQEMKKS